MGARAIERRWARTLALRAESSPDPEAVFAEAARLGEAVARDGRIAALLRDPRIREESKAKALVDCDPARGAEMRAFLLFLAFRDPCAKFRTTKTGHGITARKWKLFPSTHNPTAAG